MVVKACEITSLNSGIVFQPNTIQPPHTVLGSCWVGVRFGRVGWEWLGDADYEVIDQPPFGSLPSTPC